MLSVLTGQVADAGAEVTAPTEISVRAFPDKVTLGQPFTIEVMVNHPATLRVDARNVPADETAAVEVRPPARSRTDHGGQATTTLKFEASAWELGKQQTPALPLEAVAANGSVNFDAPGAQIEVVSTLPPDAQTTGANLFDLKPPTEIAVRTWRLLYALGIALAVGLLAFGVLRWLKRAKVATEVAAAPPRPLKVRTLDALDALAKENLPAAGRTQEFYFRLSEIIRGYLGERYRFEAMERTTPELLDALRRLHTPGLPMEELSRFTHESDFARYAKAQPDPDACKASLEFGFKLVHATAEVAMPVAPAAGVTPGGPPKAPPKAPPAAGGAA